MTTIGFVGLGHMGNPMVKNLLQAGHTLKVYDLSSKAIEPLVAAGAIAAESPADVAKDADVVFTMLQNGEQVMTTCLGEKGILQAMRADALYIDSSSIAITATRSLHEQAEKMELAMVDAPVSGGVKGAENASLTIMVGGEKAHFQRATSILQHLGKAVIYAGPAGSGQVAKICNNMILGISMIAVSEAFILGEQLGLDPKKLHEIVSHSSGQCWSLTNYCPVPNVMENVPANNHYQPGFTSAMMLKDLKLSQDAAKVAKVDVKIGELATKLYQQFVDSNHAETDFSGIITMIAQKKDIK